MSNTNELLKRLHMKSIDKFHEWLDSGEVTHQQMAVITKFLKDNEVREDPEPNSPMMDLVKRAREFTSDDFKIN